MPKKKKKNDRNTKIKKLFTLQSGECFYCETDMTMDLGYSNTATVDHVVPTSKGGVRTVYNEVGACSECNTTKGDMPLLEFTLRLRERLDGEPEQEVFDFYRNP